MMGKLWAAAAAGTVMGVVLLSTASADHEVNVQVRQLYTKSCEQAVTSALAGKATKVEIADKKTGHVRLTVPHAKAFDALAIVGALRTKGYEPTGISLKVDLGAKITLKSGYLGVRESHEELKNALIDTGMVEVGGLSIRGNSATVPVSTQDIDLLKLLNAVQKAGFALTALEIEGKPVGGVITERKIKIPEWAYKYKFSKDVLPIISRSCFGCHNADPKKQKGGLDLTPGFTAIIDYVDPGNPDDSSLYQVLTGEGAKRMPPNKALPGDDIKAIRSWILVGAKKD